MKKIARRLWRCCKFVLYCVKLAYRLPEEFDLFVVSFLFSFFLLFFPLYFLPCCIQPYSVLFILLSLYVCTSWCRENIAKIFMYLTSNILGDYYQCNTTFFLIAKRKLISFFSFSHFRVCVLRSCVYTCMYENKDYKFGVELDFFSKRIFFDLLLGCLVARHIVCWNVCSQRG